MQRASLAVLFAITLVAGITAGTMLNRPEAVVSYSSVTGSDETAIAFYRALNQALAGAGTDALAALLAPGFRDHDASIGETQTSDAFLERMHTLGQTPGAAQLAVESIETSGSSLIVQVRQAGPRSRELAGVSVERREVLPNFETLRVAQGRVIDRWSAGITRLEATELEEIALRASGHTSMTTSLMRMDIPVGAVHRSIAERTGFLLIESGTATVQVVHRDGNEETYELDRGSAVSITPGDRVQLRSANDEPVMVLAYALTRRTAGRGPEEILPVSALQAHSEGVTQSLLWNGTLAQTDAGTLHRGGTITLPPNDELRVTSRARSTLLLAIDSGTVEILAPGSEIEILGDDLWPADHDDIARIDADRAASVTPEGEIVLRNTTEYPVRVLLITIEPETNRA